MDGQAWPTTVSAGRDQAAATEEATKVLADHGWETTEGWRTEVDATYADVTRS